MDGQLGAVTTGRILIVDAPIKFRFNGGRRMDEAAQRKLYRNIALAIMVACIVFGFVQLMGWIRV